MRNVDQTLPRHGTDDLVPQRVVMRNVDPTLPRDGTDDPVPLRVVMRVGTWSTLG